MAEDPRAPRTRGIQTSTSRPDALAKAIQGASVAHQLVARRAAAMGADGDHDHADGGDHEHEHVTSRLMDHDGRIANLEGHTHGPAADGS